MTRYVNGWTAQCTWLLLMAVVGMLFVPKALSVINLGMFALMGSAVLVAAFGLWSAHQPSVSSSPARVAAESVQTPTRRA